MSKFKYQPMDPNLKKYWIKKLRSGEYEQGTEVLRNCDQFCCLGVLCDIMNPDGWKDMFTFKDLEGDLRSLDIYDDLIVDSKAERILVKMNDSGKSFNEIADWIEENL